jgi:hypothetical protein
MELLVPPSPLHDELHEEWSTCKTEKEVEALFKPKIDEIFRRNRERQRRRKGS